MLSILALISMFGLAYGLPGLNLTSPEVKGVGMLTFYEGNDLSQNQVCTLEWTEVCHYDRARKGGHMFVSVCLESLLGLQTFRRLRE